MVLSEMISHRSVLGLVLGISEVLIKDRNTPMGDPFREHHHPEDGGTARAAAKTSHSISFKRLSGQENISFS